MKAAESFHDCLRAMFPHENDSGQFFFSKKWLEPGDDWREMIDTALGVTKCMVVFLTTENIHNLGWIMYEAGVVRANKDAVVIPILIDLSPEDIEANRGFQNAYDRSPLGGLQAEKGTLNESETIKRILSKLTEAGGIPELETAHKLTDNCANLRRKWSKLAEPKNARIDPKGAMGILAMFTDEDDFAEWADKYHNVFHWGRHACVHAIERGRSLLDVESKMKASLPKWYSTPEPPSHPALDDARVSSAIHKMLEFMHDVFAKVVKVPDPGENLRICLRDLRSDGCYYTYFRSQKKEWPSRPWPQDEKAIQKLIGQTKQHSNCVIPLNEREIPAPHPDRKHHTPASMLVGAVMAKQSGTGASANLQQAGLWCLLCVSSDVPGVFNKGHERLLQGCNDIFSAVVNTILRVEHLAISPVTVSRSKKGRKVSSKQVSSRKI
jgi:hypothetical protein